MRLDRLEQMRRSPSRSPKRNANKPEKSDDDAARKKLKMDDANQKPTASGAAPPHGKEVGIGGAAAAVDAAPSCSVAPLRINAARGDADAGDWKHIDRAETVVFQFQENEDESSVLPYTLEIIWIHDDHEYFIADDASAVGGEECGEKFVPLIERAARRAVNLKSFMVRYNNQLDRTWPYTKVSRVAKALCRAKAGQVDAVLESVDDNYFEYIVNLVPRSSENKRRRGIESFVGEVDFSHMDDVKKYYVLDYIGGDAMALL